MAATRPIRVSDLVKKYGWEILIYLNNLGLRNLAEAQILFVDSNATNTLDADDGVHGHSLINSLATWDYAVGLCTAGESSVIILAPRHNENIGDEQIDLDVTDVHTIGMGSGLLKARIDFGHANSSVLFGANNNTIQNVDFLPAITDILIGVEFETDVVGCRMKDCSFLIGEDGAGVDEFIEAIKLTSGNDDTVFDDVLILAHASAAGATHGINVAAVADRVTYRNVIIDGPYATGGIVEAAAGVNLIVENCAIDVSGTNYSFDNSSTFAKRVNNVDGQVREDDSESLLVEARGSAAYPSGITDESIWAYLLSASATPAASSYDNETDSLEALSDAIAVIDNTTNLGTAVPDTPTAKSLQDILSKADGSNTYDNTTDSLEAISEAVAALNLTSAVSATPTARSLQDILEKDATSDFDDATDSLEAISDKAGGFSGDGGAAQDDSIKASLDLAHTDIDAILADTISISGATLPVAPTANSLAAFIASGGTALGQELPDSMSLVDIIGNFTGAYDGNAYDDNIFACLKVLSTFIADGDGDFATGTAMPSNVSIYDCFGGFTGDGGAAQDDSVKASLDLAHTDIDAILADTISISGGSLTATPVSGSLATFISGGSVALGQPLPASMSLIDIIGDFTGAYNGVAQDDNIKASLDLAHIDLDAILADTIMISGGALPASPTASSLARYIASGGTALGQPLPDSMSLVDMIGNYTGAYDATAADDNIKAHLDLIKTDLDYQEKCVEKVATSTDDDLFDVTGEVLITSFVGIVTTTAIGGVQNRIKVGLDATDTVDCDFSTEVDTNGDVVGTRYVFSAANPAVLTPLANGAVGSGNPQYPWVCKPGVIEQFKNGGDGGTTGQINWYVTYKPLSSDGAIAAAA